MIRAMSAMQRPFLAALAVTLTAALSSAQNRPQLSLETLLREGPRLAAREPRVLWRATGHTATVVLADERGDEALWRVADDGTVAAEPLVTAASFRRAFAAAGVPAEGPFRFPALEFLTDGDLRIDLGSSIWRWPLAGEPERLLAWPAPDDDASPFREPAFAIAPGDGFVALRLQHQLWLVARDGERRQVTFDGSEDVVYGGAAHRAEFGIDRGLFWSPDGRLLCFYREDLRQVAPYPYQQLDAVPPAPVNGRYPMAGGAQGRVTVGVLDTEDMHVAWLEHDPADDLFWTCVGFAPVGGATPDGAAAGDTAAGDTAAKWRITVTLVDRGQSQARLCTFDARSGNRLATLLDEQDAEWIEPEHAPTFRPDGTFLWWSRRDGRRHLWLCAADGAVLGQVTRGSFDVQELLRCDEVAGGCDVWFVASGEDPRQRHLFVARVRQPAGGDLRSELRGELRSELRSEVAQVTRERGWHQVSLSPDATRCADRWSSLDAAPRVVVLDTATGAVQAMAAIDDPLQRYELPQQRFFQVAADDGSVLYGHLALPPDLREGQRCPVLLYVYGGPHLQLVTDQWLGGASLLLQALAAEGIAVCRLDNRGTPNRGEAFEQAVHRQLGTLEVQDQLAAVAWLREQPWVDASRIAVHGWSFGGYMTLRLMLLAPETFACGVSGAPVTDWALYETGYGERYMDTPAENPDGYEASSCLPLAGELRRPLLLVHGTDDRTVVWAHTLQFVDRVIEAGRNLDYFPYPMQRHALAGKDRAHFARLLRGYLVRHLEPGRRE